MKNGKPFRQSRATAAHRRARIGSYAFVTDLKTKKKTKVEVTDRGPFSFAEIDLSTSAAKKFSGMMQKGYADVAIEYEVCS